MISNQAIPDGNCYHRFLGMLPVWQQDYIREMKRTSGRDVGFAACGGGWYALNVEGDVATRKPRVRQKDVVAMMATLKERPDFAPAN